MMQHMFTQSLHYSSLLKKLTAVCFLLLISACGSKTTEVPTGPLYKETLTLFTYGAADKALEKKLRKIHGQQLAESLASKALFNHTEYQGDSRDIAGHDTRLRITFVYAQQETTRWPLEIKAHYLLEQNNKTLFNHVYQVKATPYSANSHCQGCNPEQTALTMLTNKVLPELIKALKTQ